MKSIKKEGHDYGYLPIHPSLSHRDKNIRRNKNEIVSELFSVLADRFTYQDQATIPGGSTLTSKVKRGYILFMKFDISVGDCIIEIANI